MVSKHANIRYFIDMKNQGNWKRDIPEWWPEEVDFRSPNLRNPALVRAELDKIIESVQLYVRALAGDTPDIAEMEANDAEGEGGAGANIEAGASGVEGTERATSNVDAAAVAVADCSCKEFQVCSGNLYCCIFDEVPVPEDRDGLRCIVCATCSRHYHKMCVGSKLDAGLEGNEEWSCGCIIRPAYLTRFEGI